ncbi:MAG: ATP-binding cassette domain-containing protein [Clostridia bacterium]|nr:ATP-binding cassette domain-containing protein [Clostridia bacterium]
MEYCLTTYNLSKKYKKLFALKDLTMSVPKGSIYGLIGKNGAGKTTLIRIICGLQLPSGGSYSLYGVPYTDKSISLIRSRMGAVVETPSLFDNMSASDNLKHQFTLLGKTSYDDISNLLETVSLANTGKQKVKNFSLGMKQRLGIAMALAGNPDFIVLDEPVNGLDPQGIVEIRELILSLNRNQNITFLISSHILEELSKLATHYGFMDGGAIVKEISAAELEQLYSKKITIVVDCSANLAPALDEVGLEYKLLADNRAEIYGDIQVSMLCNTLACHGINLLKVNESDENLEGYYINLLGGRGNA